MALYYFLHLISSKFSFYLYCFNEISVKANDNTSSLMNKNGPFVWNLGLTFLSAMAERMPKLFLERVFILSPVIRFFPTLVTRVQLRFCTRRPEGHFKSTWLLWRQIPFWYECGMGVETHTTIFLSIQVVLTYIYTRTVRLLAVSFCLPCLQNDLWVSTSSRSLDSKYKYWFCSHFP